MSKFLSYFTKKVILPNYKIYGSMAFIAGMVSLLMSIFNLEFSWDYSVFWIILGLFLMIGIKDSKKEVGK